MILQNSEKHIDVFGWDNGFGMDKFYVNRNSLYEIERLGIKEHRTDRLSFQSVYCNYVGSIVKPVGGDLLEADRGLNPQKLVIEYKGQTYAVGQYAINQDKKGGLHSFDERKFDHETEAIKFLVAAACMFPDFNTIVINRLMVGLSLEAYVTYQKVLEAKYTQFSANFKVLSKGNVMREVSLRVNQAMCLSQGQGALYDAVLDLGPSGTIVKNTTGTNLQFRKYAILDIGDKTIDGFIAEGMEVQQRSELVFKDGVSAAYEAVSREIGASANLIESHYLNKKPLFYNRDWSYEELRELCVREFNRVADTIFKRMDLAWREDYPMLSKIFLCGGGGIAVRDRLQHLLGERTNVPLVLMDEAQFANVRGYYKIGTLHLLKQLQRDRMSAVQK